MDALLTQRQVAQTIVEKGGDYVMIVKENQPQLRADADIELVFTLPPAGDRQETARTVDIGHGRIEQRNLTTSAALVGYSRVHLDLWYTAPPMKGGTPMAGVRFTDVQARPTAFLDFTSVTLDEFQTLAADDLIGINSNVHRSSPPPLTGPWPPSTAPSCALQEPPGRLASRARLRGHVGAGRMRQQLIQRLAVLQTAPEKRRPCRNRRQWVGLLGEETPERRVMPAERVSGAVPVCPDPCA